MSEYRELVMTETGPGDRRRLWNITMYGEEFMAEWCYDLVYIFQHGK